MGSGLRYVCGLGTNTMGAHGAHILASAAALQASVCDGAGNDAAAETSVASVSIGAETDAVAENQWHAECHRCALVLKLMLWLKHLWHRCAMVLELMLWQKHPWHAE